VSVSIPEDRLRMLAALEGLISEEMGLRLAELAATVPADQAIVECGSYKGKSGCYLAEGAMRGKGALVVCIDPWDLEGNINGRFGFAESGTKIAFSEQVASMGVRIVALQAFGADAGRDWDGPPVGMLHIDSHHTYDGVMADFTAWEPHLAPRAIVCFDDYHSENRCNAGVTVAVDELTRRPGWRLWELKRHPCVGFRE
jgi:hypothetical protein